MNKNKTGAKYFIAKRDWKGTYDKIPKGWKLFCAEDEIETGGDYFATIYFKGHPKKKLSGQEIFNLQGRLMCGNVEGWDNVRDSKGNWDTDIVVEKI